MNRSEVEIVAEILQRGGVGWLATADEPIRAQVACEISETQDLIAQRLALPGLDLWQELQQDPAGLAPLIQLFASPTSLEMKAMVYGVLRGMEIKTIKFEYQTQSAVKLDVTILDTQTGAEHIFKSTMVWDVEILRHLEIMTLNDKPVLQGFYAFQGS